MKTILKIFLLISLFVCSIGTINAQYPKKRITSDIHVGLNLAGMDIKNENTYKQAKVGVHIGFNVNYKFWSNVQLQTGLFVTKKGLKRHIHTVEKNGDISVTTYDGYYNATGNYIQMPFNLGYELYFTKSWAFNINGGLYAAYGYKGTGTTSSVTVISDNIGKPVVTTVPEVEFESFTPDRWRRFDYGLNAKVGLVYDIYTINIGYEYGLYNIAYTGPELKNRNFFVSFGFRF